jgi:glycosyltransferase involved in cell wall biosynthesis
MKTTRPLHVAILGHRGIPGNYGGFETFAEELAVRMVRTGHTVDVYCRTNTGSYRDNFYKGVRLIHLSTVSNKYLDTLVHTGKALLHATFMRRPDIILAVNVGNTILTWIPRLFGIPVVLNVDGLEWERQKWNGLARSYLRISAWLTRFLPTAVVTDAKVIQDFYQERIGLSTHMIPYGAEIVRRRNSNVLEKYGTKPQQYYLYVARFEPENNAHLVVKAFENVRSNKKLIMVGDAPYAAKYCRLVRDTKDPRIIFTGFVYGADYKTLQQNAYAYVQATEVGGTHPALIEAMGYGNCVLVNATPENMETTNGSAVPFWFYRGHRAAEGLTRKMQLIEDKPQMVREFRKKAVTHVRRTYRWDVVTRQYQDLFEQVLTERKLAPLPQSREATRHS